MSRYTTTFMRKRPPAFGTHVGGDIATIDRSEWDALYKKLVKQASPIKLDDAVRKAAEDGQELIRSITPVKTGLLRDSIEVERLRHADYLIATYVRYGGWVEVGHMAWGKFFVPGRHMFLLSRPRIARRLKAALEKLVTKK